VGTGGHRRNRRRRVMVGHMINPWRRRGRNRGRSMSTGRARTEGRAMGRLLIARGRRGATGGRRSMRMGMTHEDKARRTGGLEAGDLSGGLGEWDVERGCGAAR
jgi:hypothetical protein